MIKKILLIIFSIVISSAQVFADTSCCTAASDDYIQSHSAKLLEKIKSKRVSIYNSLELTSVQTTKINELDHKLYERIEPELKKLSVLTKKIEDIANSDNCTKKAVNNVKKEFRVIEHEINSIKKDYDKEFKTILSPNQKSEYRLLLKQKRMELKEEIEKNRESQKN